MKTRDRIIERAIDMFNEKGAANVSTVQLSEALGISPGNLYYYFITIKSNELAFLFIS